MSTFELVAEAVKYREAGDQKTACALQMAIAWRLRAAYKRQIRAKVPSQEVESVFSDVYTAAGLRTFPGNCLEDLMRWLGGITRNKIADFTDGRSRRQLRSFDAIPADISVACETNPNPYVCGASPHIGTDDVERTIVLGGVLAEQVPSHAHAIRLRMSGFSTREAAAATGLSPANVDQIVSRYRRDCYATLDPIDADHQEAA